MNQQIETIEHDDITDATPVEQDQLAVVVASSPLEKTKAQQLKEIFMPYLDKMSEVEKKIKLINADNPGKEDIAIARQIRLALKDNRVAAEKMKDDKKASILIEGRLIDSLYGVINNTSKGLELQLQNIEKAAEIAEIKRKQALAIERSELLNIYEIDLTGYDLGAMSDATFAQLLENTKIGHEKRLEDKRIEEELRIQREANERLHKERKEMLLPVWNFTTPIDDYSMLTVENFEAMLSSARQLKEQHEAEQLRIKEENERLKKIQETKDARNKELRPYIVFIRDYDKMLSMSDEDYAKELADIKTGAEQQWEYERKEQIRKQQEADAKQDLHIKRYNAIKPYAAFTNIDMTTLSDLTLDAFNAILFDAQAAFNKEKQEREAKELQAKKDKEELERITKEKEAAELAKKKAELAPDKEKLLVLASELDAYKLPVLVTAEATIIINSIRELLNKTSAYIRQKAEQL